MKERWIFPPAISFNFLFILFSIMVIRYTVQKFSEASRWANPEGTDVSYCYNKQDVADMFNDWGDTVDRYGDRQEAYLRVWCGELSDVTDQYPDFELRFGPRGGIKWNPC